MAFHYTFLALRKALQGRKHPRFIAIDETKMKLIGNQLFLGAARDVETREVLAYRCSFKRSILDAELFLKNVLKYFENKPIFLLDKPLVC